MSARPTFSGSGPGVQAPDGCSVELYRQLPYMGELADIETALSGVRSALELGCGSGRLCARLRDLGLAVSGVDESAAMLAHLPAGVEGIQGSIETLDLGRQWPAVLLPSHLINHPDGHTRRAFLTAARRHTSPDGTFFAKRHDPGWLATMQPGPLGGSHGVTIHAEQVVRDGPWITMTLRYELLGQRWTQSFTTLALSEAQVEALLRQAGFIACRWFGAGRLWVSATVGDAS